MTRPEIPPFTAAARRPVRTLDDVAAEALCADSLIRSRQRRRRAEAEARATRRLGLTIAALVLMWVAALYLIGSAAGPLGSFA